jgi:hypothetical protein
MNGKMETKENMREKLDEREISFLSYLTRAITYCKGQ